MEDDWGKGHRMGGKNKPFALELQTMLRGGERRGGAKLMDWDNIGWLYIKASYCLFSRFHPSRSVVIKLWGEGSEGFPLAPTLCIMGTGNTHVCNWLHVSPMLEGGGPQVKKFGNPCSGALSMCDECVNISLWGAWVCSTCLCEQGWLRQIVTLWYAVTMSYLSHTLAPIQQLWGISTSIIVYLFMRGACVYYWGRTAHNNGRNGVNGMASKHMETMFLMYLIPFH